MKERITITLESDILSKVDKRVDGLNVKNRSHAFEILLLGALGENKPKKALILAGGMGKRFQPMTLEMPKVMIPFRNKPIIEHQIDFLRSHDIRDILVSVGYKKEKIKEYLGNGSKFGVNITYIEEESPLGTAGPIALAKPYLDNTFLVCNGDVILNLDVPDMFLFHKQSGALATIALTTVDDPSSYGVADMRGSKILKFVEKPKKEQAPSRLINAGVYIMEPEVLKLIPESGYVMVENNTFPKLAEQQQLVGYPYSGQWFDLGTPERYKTALKEWKG